MVKNQKKLTFGTKRAQQGALTASGEQRDNTQKAIIGEIKDIIDDLQIKKHNEAFEDLFVSNNTQSIRTIISNINDSINVASGFLTVLVGSLMGEKSINLKTSPASLISKVNQTKLKNTVFREFIEPGIDSKIEKKQFDAIIKALNSTSKSDNIVSSTQASVEIPDSFWLAEPQFDAIVDTLESLKSKEEIKTTAPVTIDSSQIRELITAIDNYHDKVLGEVDIIVKGVDKKTTDNLLKLANLTAVDTNLIPTAYRIQEFFETLANVKIPENIDEKLDIDFLSKLTKKINKLNPIKETQLSTAKDINEFMQILYEISKNSKISNSKQIVGKIDSVSLIIDALNNLTKTKVNNKVDDIFFNIQSLLNTIKTLYDLTSQIKVVEAPSLTPLFDFINQLQMMPIINNSKEIGRSIEDIVNLISSINKIDITKTRTNIDSLKNNPIDIEGSFEAVIDSIHKLGTRSKNEISNVDQISGFFSAITHISGFDENGYDTLKNNIRRLIYLTEPASKFTSIGIVDRGLIDILFKNVAELSKKSDLSNKDVKIIAKALNIISTIGTDFNEDKLDDLEDSIISLNKLIGQNHLDKSYNLFRLLMNIHQIGEYTKDTKSDISNINTLFQNLGTIGSTTDIKISKEIREKALSWAKTIATIHLLTGSLKSIKKEDLVKANKSIYQIKTLLDSLESIDGKKLADIVQMSSSFKKLSGALAIAGIAGPLAVIGIFFLKKEVEGLSKIINIINKSLDPKKIKEANDNLVPMYKILFMCSGLMVLGAFAGKLVLDHFAEIIGFTISLGIFIVSVIGTLNLATIGMKEAKVNAKEFTNLLLISSAIMFLGGSIMLLQPKLILGALMFSVSFGAFIFSTLSAINLASIDMQDAFKNIDKFEELLILSSACLLIGSSFMMMNGTFWSAIRFTIALGLFIGGIITVWGLANKRIINESMMAARDFALLVGVSSLSLIIGGLFMKNPMNMLNALLFTIGLGLFMSAIFGVLKLADMMNIENTIKVGEEFAWLIGTLTMALTIGGLFMMIPGLWKNSLMFAGILSLQVLAIVGIFSLFGNKSKETLKAGKEFAWLIGTLTIAIAVGGLFMMIPRMAQAAFKFTLLLSFTVFAIVGTFTLFRKQSKEIMSNAIIFAGVVTLLSAVLVGSAYLISKYDLGDDLITFAVTSAGFVAVMGVAIWLMGKISKNALIAGELAMAGVAGIIWLLGNAFQEVAIAASIMDQVDDFNDKLITMGIVVGSIAALVGIIGGLATLGGGLGAVVIAAGEAALAGICGIMSKAASAFKETALAMQEFSKVEAIDTNTIKSNLDAMISILPSLSPLTNPLVALEVKAAASSMGALGNMISSISDGVAKYASLTIPEYDEEGHPTGKVTRLKSSDFTNASKNVELVITTLGLSLMNTFKEHKDWFKDDSLLGKIGLGRASSTPFGMMMTSLSRMGKLVNDVASGISSFANMKFSPKELGFDKEGEPLNTNIFKLASDNIALVITTIGSTLMTVFGTHKEWFEDPSWFSNKASNTPFGMMITSLSGMGNLVKTYADAIGDFANLKVPVVDENGVIVEGKFRQLQEADFTNASESIQKVIETCGASLMTVYNNHKNDWFSASNGQYYAPFYKMKLSLGQIAEIVSYAADIATKLSEIKIEDTTEKSFTENLGKIIKDVPNTIATILDSSIGLISDKDYTYGDFFDKDNINGVDIDDVEEAFEQLVDIVKYISECNSELGGLQDNIPTNLEDIITGIPSAIATLTVDTNARKFIYDSQFQSNLKQAFKNSKDAIEEMADSYKEIFELREKINDVVDNTVITSLGGGLTAMINGLKQSLYKDKKLILETSTIEYLNNAFVTAIENYKSGLSKLFEVYNMAPEDITKYDNTIYAVHNINDEIAKVSNTQQFKTETQDLSSFVTSINSLDTHKTDILTNLIVTLDKMATKLGGLDNLTIAISEKLTVVLNELVEQLQEAKKTLDTADKAQKQRKIHIDKSIERIQTLLNDPLKVVISQEEVEGPKDQNLDNSNNSISRSSYSDDGGSSFISSTDSITSKVTIGKQYDWGAMFGYSGGRTGQEEET